jgi:hypothetical protein
VNNKIITEELAKLYESQGYLEDALQSYSLLYKKTNKKKFAKAIENLKNKITPTEEKSVTAPVRNYKDEALKLFEKWLNIVVLEKEVQNFKKIQAKQE